MFTINHPGNRILVELARRIQLALNAPADAADPGRDLLGEVRAPMPAAALTALGFTDTASSTWQVGERSISAEEVHRVQWQWYRDNPWVVDAGYARHRETMNLLGLDDDPRHRPARRSDHIDAATSIDAAIAMGWSGPDDHGITLTARHIASAAITLGFGGAVLHEAQPDRLMNLVDRLPPSTRLLHLQVNDWLFADAGMDVDHTIATLADRLQRRRVALALTLHDLPQRSNGDALYRRRCNTYRRMVAASVGVAVSSEHERLLLQEALRHTPAAEVPPVSAGGPAGVPLVVIPLPIEPMVTSGPTHGLPTPTLDRTRPGDPVPPTIGIFGYLYPGKGHREVIEALTGMDSRPAVVAIGRASDRHTELLDDLTELAARRGIVFRCTGYVSDAELPACFGV